MHKKEQRQDWDTDMLCYINVTLWVRRYIITCLCPNLVSVPFYAIPIFPFKFPKFFIYLSPIIFFGPNYMHFAIFVVYLVANILANRACSLRLSNIFIANQLFVYYIVPYFTFSGAFVNEI